MMQDPKEGINSVQTVRNMIISVALLATADAGLISTLLNLLTDPQRLQQMRVFSEQDPISGGEPLIGPAVKVALALAALFFSFLTFAQCVRIAVHLVRLIFHFLLYFYCLKHYITEKMYLIISST